MNMAQPVRAQGPLTITTTSLPTAAAGADFETRIGATGGTQPYTWQVVEGRLPAGLKLDRKTGKITGTPTTPGEYHFDVAVSDSGVPSSAVQRSYTLIVTSALSIDWKDYPRVSGQRLEGSVVVSNQTAQSFTLTVILMAVNDIGRATALGYQEFEIKAGAEQVIPFGSEPGPGSYVVHADAVGEVVKTNTIYRARKQTTGKLVIHSPE